METVPINIAGAFKYKARNDESGVYYNPPHNEKIRKSRINKHIAGDLHILVGGASL